MESQNLQNFKTSVFEEFKKLNENGDEYWSPRDFYKILDYQKWEKFLGVIEKAKEACNNSGYNDLDHFPRMEKLVDIGSGAKRDIGDLYLSRYANYC
ncbi:MAG: DNA-damage-inducible protein family protein [Ignavibacteria bacterium]|nr:DNA-damage-inducible protein family protein [Ignavibacteria bacterium]